MVVGIAEVDVPCCFKTSNYIRKDICLGGEGEVCKRCFFALHYIDILNFVEPLADVEDMRRDLFVADSFDFLEEMKNEKRS